MTLLAPSDVASKDRAAAFPLVTPDTPYAFPMPDKNTLFYGDNLDVLPRIAPESVDLIYLDPPFKSDAKYNVLFRTVQGQPSSAQIHAFDDTWAWSLEAEATFQEFVTARSSPPEVVTFLKAMFTILGKSDMMAYLVMMAPRLVEMRRALKSTGSIYLHCDPTASHYLKMLMDQIFQVKNFQNEIIWSYRSGGASPKHFSRKHDTLLCYSKTAGRYFQPLREISYNRGFKPYRFKGVEEFCDEGGRWYTKPYMRDVWDIDMVGRTSAERLNYPTQKPIALLKRIIESSCPEGGEVLDPFCGCGTAVDAAQELGRRWTGIDIAYIAVDLIRNRLVGRYGQDILGTFKTEGLIPRDMEGARALFVSNPIDFERWAVSLVQGQPTKASGDEGIDGKIHFAKTYREPLEVGICVVSVKGGETVNPGMVRDLAGTVAGSASQMGLLITRVPVTDGMAREATKHGSYVHEATGTLCPKIQLLTIAELLAGTQPKVPSPLPPYMQATWAPQSEAVPLF